MRHSAIPSTSQQSRYFELERQTPLQHTFNLTKCFPRRNQIMCCFHRGLAFTIVTHACCFQNRRKQLNARHCRIKLRLSANHRIRCNGHTALLNKGFFNNAVLCNRHRIARRRNGNALAKPAQNISRHIFKLRGHCCAVIRHLLQCNRIVIRCTNVVVGNLPSGAMGIRFEHPHGVAHRLSGLGKHTPQLTASNHTECGRRQNRH